VLTGDRGVGLLVVLEPDPQVVLGERLHQVVDDPTRCREDNALVKATLSEPGKGKVVVVDGHGSLRSALMGDMIAEIALSNGWHGVIVNGAVRDVQLLDQLPIGVKALGSNPRKSTKTGSGQRDVPVSFGGALLTPGREVVSDEDGIVVLP
jgi:regulator of ribonuclease activity A